MDPKKTIQIVLVVLVAFAAAQNPAAARLALRRQLWSCSYEGPGGAHYVTRFERRGDVIVELNFATPATYRILADSHDILVAAHGEAEGASFRRDPRGSATILTINKLSGQMQRTVVSGDGTPDQHFTGSCRRL